VFCDQPLECQLTFDYRSSSDLPACWWATETSRETLCAICSLKLNAERPENIDAPARPRLPVLLVLRHGSRDLAVNQPVAAVHIVVVTARSGALGKEGAHMLDRWERPHGAALGRGRHCE
jgi:hypothetical protein